MPVTFNRELDLSAEAAARMDARHEARHHALIALYWSALPHPILQGGNEAAWEPEGCSYTELMTWGRWPRHELTGYHGPHRVHVGVAWDSGRPAGARVVSGLIVRACIDVVGGEPIKVSTFTERDTLHKAGAWIIDATQWADEPAPPRPGEMRAPWGPRDVLPCGRRLMLGEAAGLARPSSQQARDNIGFYLALASAIGHDTRAALKQIGVLSSMDARLVMTEKPPKGSKR